MGMNTGAGNKIAFIDEGHPSAARRVWACLGSWWRRTMQLSLVRQSITRLRHRAPRRLRLNETLQLGDRRFVAVIEFEKARFLLGGTHASLTLLARLDRENTTIPVVDAMNAGPNAGSGEKLN
jgi:hypothetical protein